MYTEFHILVPPHDKKKIKLTSLNLYKSFYKIIMKLYTNVSRISYLGTTA